MVPEQSSPSHNHYAPVWQGHVWTLFFDINTDDPEVSGGSSSKPVTFGSPIGELPVPRRPGYTLTGWTKTRNSIYGGPISPATDYGTDADSTVYAYWTVKAPTFPGGTITLVDGMYNSVSIATGEADGTPAIYFSDAGGNGPDYYGMTLSTDGIYSGTPRPYGSQTWPTLPYEFDVDYFRVKSGKTGADSFPRPTWTIRIIAGAPGGGGTPDPDATTNLPVRATGITVGGAGGVDIAWEAPANRTVLSYTVRASDTLAVPPSVWAAAETGITPAPTNRMTHTLPAPTPTRFFQIWAEVLK